jgi:hypothetical protein
MSETYEVGVTLSLNDGVSEGIARAREEIATLQRVLATSGVSIAELRKTAAKANPAIQPRGGGQDVRGEAAGTPAITVPMDQATPSALAMDLVRALQLLTVTDVSHTKNTDAGDWAEPTARQALSPNAVQLSAQKPSAPAVDVAPPKTGMNGSVREQSPATTPTSTSFTAIQVTGASDSERWNRVPTIRVQQPTATAGPALLTSSALSFKELRLEGRDRSSLDQTNRGDVNTALRSYGPTDVPDFGRRIEQHSESAPAARQETEGVGRDAWHEQVAQPSSAAPSLASVASAPARASSASANAEPKAGTQGPVEGDVYLDGMLVGRWMSRFLAREAGRASAGPTGFDGRRGQLLPGATVGT